MAAQRLEVETTGVATLKVGLPRAVIRMFRGGMARRCRFPATELEAPPHWQSKQIHPGQSPHPTHLCSQGERRVQAERHPLQQRGSEGALA
jgi:hypothetical protein